MSSHVIGIDIDVYCAFDVIFNILCLEVAYDSMRLFYWYLHYIYGLILYLCIMYYTVCYPSGIFYVVVRQISMLFIDNNKISVFCILTDREGGEGEREADRQTDRQTEKTDRDRQTETERRLDRHTDRQTERQSCISHI